MDFCGICHGDMFYMDFHANYGNKDTFYGFLIGFTGIGDMYVFQWICMGYFMGI